MALMLYVGYRVLLSFFGAKKPSAKSSGSRGPAEVTYRDPVCGIYVSEEAAVIGTHEGTRHHFCSMNCLEKYRERLSHTD